ncbi:MAG TPA: hypothetical protein OIL90_05725 [Phascolarctobacterium faecium]|nr:hypothetical protein [Phascolarctobacterium faecium]HJI09604.1 hypothetical protein [Phascolarctobacterium faecium]
MDKNKFTLSIVLGCVLSSILESACVNAFVDDAEKTKLLEMGWNIKKVI